VGGGEHPGGRAGHASFHVGVRRRRSATAAK
jgi:hypothetical protein